MPSNIDNAFIDNLQNFTDSLESIVELLKQQAEKGDAVNKMLSTMDGPKLSDISKDMKSILETSKSIDNRTKQILEEIKATRKQKESGMFDKIEGKENKHKIVDGIKTVVLIAGGVLAMGLAFKLVGHVDFLSVVSLSLGILTMAYAFEKIAQIKDLTPTKAAFVGLSVIMMAGAITIASFALKNFQPMTVGQTLSFLLVSSALGVSAYFIFKSVERLKLTPKDMWKYLALPIILPAIATGIALSSIALKNTQPIGLMQAISAVFVGIALIAGSVAVSMIMKYIIGKDNKVDMKSVGLALLILPGIAAGLVVSSVIFQGFMPIKNPLMVAFSSLMMGISILAFVPTVFILGKMNLKQVAIGTLGAVMISAAIMISSWIISVGKYDGNYPSAKWAIGVGLSLILFTPSVVILGFLGMSGAGAVAIVIGAGLTILVAATIVATSHILKLGDYSTFPSLKWAAGVGLALLTFTPTLVLLGVLGPLALLGMLFIKKIANTIVEVADILNQGKFDVKGPSEEWVKGFGNSILLFSNVLSDVDRKDIRRTNKYLPELAQSMVDVSNILARGNFNTTPGDWAVQITNLFDVFVNKVPTKDQLRKLQDFIEVIKDLGKAANNIKDSGLDKLNKLTANVTIMSVIDNQRLQSVMKTMDDNKSTISNIIESDGRRIDTPKQITTEIDKTNTVLTSNTMVDKQDKMIEKFDTVIKKFDQLLDYITTDGGPDNTGKVETTKRK